MKYALMSLAIHSLGISRTPKRGQSAFHTHSDTWFVLCGDILQPPEGATILS